MRGKRDKSKGKGGTVIIRREEVAEAGSHGGAWKVAYADFVTAMMAFFLLMWLLNATTEEQRKGLADYFAPTNLFSHGSSGTGLPFGGHTAFDNGALVSDRGVVQVIPGNRPAVTDEGDQENQQAPVPGDADREADSAPDAEPGRPAARAVAQPGAPSGTGTPVGAVPDGPPDGPVAGAPTADESPAERALHEQQAFATAARQVSEAVRGDPALAELVKQLSVDVTPEGLRIQILDAEQRPMFALGSAEPNERARLLLRKVAPVLVRLRHSISIAGNTDAAPFPGPGRTNWELSADRANATRRLLVDAGFPEHRIRAVTGNADRDLLLPSDPLAAANRRIAIMVLRSAGLRTSDPPPPRPAGAPAGAPARETPGQPGLP